MTDAHHDNTAPGAGGQPQPAHADLYDAPPTPQVEDGAPAQPQATPVNDAPAEQAAAKGGKPDRPDGFPDLNSHRTSAGSGRRWLSVLAFLVVAMGGGIWAVHRVVTQHQAEVKHERDTAGEDSGKGRSFGQPPPNPNTASASVPAVNGAPGSATPAQPINVGVANVQPVDVRPVGQTHDASARPTPSWYDADLVLASERADGASGAGNTPTQSASGASGSQSSGGGGLVAALTPTVLHPVQAGLFGNRDLLLSAGAKIPCAGDTAFNSTLAGISTCTVTSNVYSDNGHVLLIERGSEINTEFRQAPGQGQKRVFILSARIKTPNGVKVQIDSPAADALGRMGIDGDVDNHWGERIGAALLLALTHDAIGYLASRGGSSTGTVMFQNTQQTGNDMADKVLSSTINIPPTLNKNQGADFLIVLARDLDFSSVYALEAK